MFTFQQNLNNNPLDCGKNKNITQGNLIGFRPIFSNGMPSGGLWINSNMGYYVPNFLGFPVMASQPMEPCLTAQDSPSHHSDGWSFNYLNCMNNGHHNPLPLHDALNQEQQNVMVKEEDKNNYETVNHSNHEAKILHLIKQEVVKQQKKPKRKPIDKDYMPHRSQKKQPRKRLHQNQNRNVIPNEINQIISFLQKKTKSQHVLAKIWQRYPADEKYSISRFYLYQNILKEKSGHYSNEKQLGLLSDLYEPECKIWSYDQQRHYITLSRVLVGHFLREDSIPIILTSKRMRSQKKLQHLKARREVIKRVLKLMDRQAQ